MKFYTFEKWIAKIEPKWYYDNVRLEMLQFLPHDVKIVLDVGCGNGAFAEIIKEQNHAEVWGIELMEEHAKEAQKKN